MSADPAGFGLVNPMEQDNEGKLKAKQDYSIVEALNWYSYVSNNPVKYVDPTGKRRFLPVKRASEPVFSVTVYRQSSSWESTFNEGWSHENVGLDRMVVTNTASGNSITVPLQSVANQEGFPDTNTVVGSFELKRAESISFEGPELLIMNARTVHGAVIGPDGTGVDTDGSFMGASRWLVHSPRQGGLAQDDSAPFSGGCFIPTSYEEHMKLMNFLKDEGLTDNMVIKGQVVEK